jgi:hypothetical protein
MFDIQSIKDTIAEINLEEKIEKIKSLHSQSVEIRRQINEVTAFEWKPLSDIIISRRSKFLIGRSRILKNSLIRNRSCKNRLNVP